MSAKLFVFFGLVDELDESLNADNGLNVWRDLR